VLSLLESQESQESLRAFSVISIRVATHRVVIGVPVPASMPQQQQQQQQRRPER